MPGERQDDQAPLPEGHDLLPAGEAGIEQGPAVADIADGELRELDPRFVPCDRIASWITSGVLAVLGAVGLLLTWLNAWLNPALVLLILLLYVVLVVLLAVSSHWLPVLTFRYTRWAVSDLGIEIRRGIWWRRVINVPRTRIQHTDVGQGPLQRRFGIATLKVHTAGTEDASVELSGLEHATARLVRDFLIGWQHADDGV